VDFVTWPGTPKALVELERRREGKPPSIVILSNQQTAAILEAAGYEASTRDPRATELLERVCLAMGHALLVDKQIDRAPSAAHWRDETERVIQALKQAAVALSDAPLPVRRLARAEWRAAKEAAEALIERLETVRRAFEGLPGQHRPTSSAARGAVVELAGVWRDWRCAGRHPLSRREQRRQARDFVSTCLEALNFDLSFRTLCALVRHVID
jgi:hypothetical protein